MNKDRKSTVKKSVFAVIILALLVALIGGTYARYSSDFSGTASLSVAKWNVKVDSSETLNLKFEREHNTNVVNEKIAPATKATAKVNVDLEGTEVAVDLIVEKGEGFDEKIRQLGITTGDQIKFTIKKDSDTDSNFTTPITGNGDSGSPWVIPLQSDSAFTSSHVVKVEVSIEWTNDDSHNSEDTAAGKQGGTLELPVKLTAKQHIASEAA